MACASPSLTTVEGYNEGQSSAMSSGIEERKLLSKRRHSSFHPRRPGNGEYTMDGEESLLIKVLLLHLRCSGGADSCGRSISSSLNLKEDWISLRAMEI